jgi:hypothetical protein
VLSQELHLSRSPPARLPRFYTTLTPASRCGQDPICRAPFRARWPLDPGRLRSARASTLRSSDASSRSQLRLRVSASHPFTRRGVDAPRQGVTSASCYIASSRFASRLPSIARGRCSSPTSATDSRHEHPWIVWLPCAGLSPRRPLPRIGREPVSGAAPAHLSVTQPRVERA